jgi:cell division transport system ATP-binding protein
MATRISRSRAAQDRARATSSQHPRPDERRPRTARPVIEFRNVSKLYAGDVGLEEATFSVERGEFVFLVGSTGSGKSTLMRLLIKELEPTSGIIRVAGKSLEEIPRKRVPYFRRNVGVVFQDFKLLPNRTVYDNVAYALQVTGGSRKEIRAKVPDILRLTGLSTKLHNYPHQLSGGEQQRVSVARAFVNHPPLLLADEPTGNLDPETSIDIMRLLYRINRTGTTVMVATHDQAMVDKMRRRVLELSRGRIVRDEAAGLYTRPRRRRPASGSHADRLLPARSGPRDSTQRRPQLRRPGHRARHAARARRVHPDRAGHQRRRQQRAQPCGGRRLHEDERERG